MGAHSIFLRRRVQALDGRLNRSTDRSYCRPFPMNLRYLYQDLLEIPLVVKLARAVREVRSDAKTCGLLIRDQAEKIPDRTALRFESESLTYGELNLEVNRVANLLRRAGVGKGNPVAIMMENS